MSVPAKFKAAMVSGRNEQHTIVERSLPPLRSGEPAIRITVAAINPIDWKMRDFDVFIPSYPAVLGSDAAGEIAAVGPDIPHLRINNRVFFQEIINSYNSCTFQQYAKMDAALVARTPRNIGDDEASGIMLASMAALTGFYDSTGNGLPAPWDAGGHQVGTGAAVVIIGGSSSMGQYAIQPARLSGFSKIITNSNPAHAGYLKRLGATTVLSRDATADDFAATIGYNTVLDFILNTISTKATKELSVDIVKKVKKTKTLTTKIIIVLVEALDFEGFEASDEPRVALSRILGVGSSPSLRYLSEPFVRHLGGEDGYIARGMFQPNRPIVVPGGLGGLEAALTKNKNGVSGVKVVIRPLE